MDSKSFETTIGNSVEAFDRRLGEALGGFENPYGF